MSRLHILFFFQLKLKSIVWKIPMFLNISMSFMHTRISFMIFIIYIYVYILFIILYIYIYISSFCIYLYNVANDRRCIYVQIVTVPDPRTTIINGKKILVWNHGNYGNHKAAIKVWHDTLDSNMSGMYHRHR